MANRILSAEEINIELRRLAIDANIIPVFTVGDLYIEHVATGMKISYSTSDLLMDMSNFSARLLQFLVNRVVLTSNQRCQSANQIVAERGSTHGDYSEMSVVIQSIKSILHSSYNWNVLNAGQKEALDLIATKIGRIVTGDPNHPDHWIDGSGYFKLGEGSCKK